MASSPRSVCVPLLLVLCCLSIIACLFAGCRSEQPVVVQDDKSAQNLQAIGAAYTQAELKLGRPPRDAQDMAELLKKMPNSPDPEQVLKSPDDNEPYVIVWNLRFAELAKSGNSDSIIAYEAKGKNGKRHVLRPPSIIQVLSEGEFRAAKFPPGHQPATSSASAN